MHCQSCALSLSGIYLGINFCLLNRMLITYLIESNLRIMFHFAQWKHKIKGHKHLVCFWETQTLEVACSVGACCSTNTALEDHKMSSQTVYKRFYKTDYQ